MVYVGRLALEKSPGILLKSLALLLTGEFPNLLDHLAPIASTELIEEFRNRFHLKIIGDGPLYRPMQNFIAKYNMSKHFTFLDNLPPNTLQTHLRSASALINPGIYGETFGLVHIEALTMGIPSIGFDLGGVKESLQVGMLIDHFSRSKFEQQVRDPISSLAEAILLMFDSHQQFIEQRKNICMIAQEVFQQSFSLDVYVKSVLDIIQYMFSL